MGISVEAKRKTRFVDVIVVVGAFLPATAAVVEAAWLCCFGGMVSFCVKSMKLNRRKKTS